MSVKIRLKKTGRTNQPSYRIVAIDSRSKRDGRELEILGMYDPRAKDASKRLVLKGDRIADWKAKGAIPSDTVASLLRRAARAAAKP